MLPLVDGYSTDYLPAPRAPGTLEPPTSGPISMVPVVHRRLRPLVAAGAPVRVTHDIVRDEGHDHDQFLLEWSERTAA